MIIYNTYWSAPKVEILRKEAINKNRNWSAEKDQEWDDRARLWIGLVDHYDSLVPLRRSERLLSESTSYLSYRICQSFPAPRFMKTMIVSLVAFSQPATPRRVLIYDKYSEADVDIWRGLIGNSSRVSRSVSETSDHADLHRSPTASSLSLGPEKLGIYTPELGYWPLKMGCLSKGKYPN